MKQDDLSIFYILTLILTLSEIVHPPGLSITYFYIIRSYLYSFGSYFAHIIKNYS